MLKRVFRDLLAAAIAALVVVVALEPAAAPIAALMEAPPLSAELGAVRIELRL